MTAPLGEDLHKAFLEDMQALENFRVSYTSVHSGASVERDDPEVRRLLDAMALMTARTRIAALRSLLATQRRLFRQYFSFLLTPMPAVGMMQAVLSGRFAEPVTLPRGTELRITSDGSAPAFFQTTSELRLLPLRLERLETLLRSTSGFRIILSFKAPYARNDDLGTLPIYVNHLDDYPASLTVFHNLKKHLEGITAVFGEDVDDQTSGPRCKVTFGARPEPDALPQLGHPLQQVRTFLHQPQRDLLMNVEIPEGARNWKQLNLCIDLDASWPKALRLNKDMFQLFTVPITNLRRAHAAPIAATGTKSRYTVRHPEPGARFALHSVAGVFEMQPKGMVPLKPGLLAGGNGSYEVDDHPDGGDAPQIDLHYPEAFATPKKIAVDAHWIQPWFSELAGGNLRVQLHSRAVEGVQFEVRGPLRPHVPNPLLSDFEGMLQILALKNKTVGFSLDDVGTLVNALGVVREGPFRELVSQIGDLSVSVEPHARKKGGGQVHRYRLRLAPSDATARPVLETGLEQLARLLRAWTTDADVTIEAMIAGEDGRIEIA